MSRLLELWAYRSLGFLLLVSLKSQLLDLGSLLSHSVTKLLLLLLPLQLVVMMLFSPSSQDSGPVVDSVPLLFGQFGVGVIDLMCTSFL